MTRDPSVWDLLSGLGLGLVIVSGLACAFVIVGLIRVCWEDYRDRREQAKRDVMINAVDALLFAKRLEQDRDKFVRKMTADLRRVDPGLAEDFEVATLEGIGLLPFDPHPAGWDEAA